MGRPSGVYRSTVTIRGDASNRSTLMKPTDEHELVFVDLPPAGDVMVKP